MPEVAEIPFVSVPYRRLTFGVDLRGFTGSIAMRPGWAQDAQDVLPRDDGAVHRVVGWVRENDSAISGRPLELWGFSYRGKNVPAADTDRGGVFGVTNDGVDFTRRSDQFHAFVLLTTTTFYRWDPVTQALVSVPLPSGVSINEVKPVGKVAKESLYIVGWGTENVRYDPTDHALYRWGWEAPPAAPGLALVAGGDLVVGQIYKYGISYINNYTGQESAMSEAAEITITANRTVRVTAAAYAGDRHFNDLATATDTDVSVNIWRTFGNGETFYYLATLLPGDLSYDDGDALGLVTDEEPFQGTQQDEPRFTALEEYRGRFYALSRFSDSSRMYFSDPAQFERWRVRGYKDLPVTGGDYLTAIGKTDTTLLCHRGRGGFRVTSIDDGGPRPDLIVTDLPWEAGAVGAGARESLNGYEYWLSERGPMRWREGQLATEWIGRPLLPLFIDATSGLCQLNAGARELSEVQFDWEQAMMKFIFATGPNTYPNHFWGYWVHAEKYNDDPESGWFRFSPRATAMGKSLPLGGLDVTTGKPVSPQERKELFFFADDRGYLYRYDFQTRRGGLKPGALAKTFAVAGSTTTVINSNSGLLTGGDGLKGMRLEVTYLATGQRHARVILSNTTSTITLEDPLPTAPATGDILYISGIPAYWRSWVDHMNAPHAHKEVTHLLVGMQRLSTTPGEEFLDWRAEIRVATGEFPQEFTRERYSTLDKYRRKITVKMVGVDWLYEIANSRPDESFVLTNFEVRAKILPQRRIA